MFTSLLMVDILTSTTLGLLARYSLMITCYITWPDSGYTAAFMTGEHTFGMHRGQKLRQGLLVKFEIRLPR